MALVYKPNKKHKRVAARVGPPRQVPARVLRQLRDRGDITSAEYRSLLGSAR